MRKNKTIPTQGQFSDVIGVVGENFNRQYMNLLELQFNMQKFCGMFKTLDILNSTVTSPQEGMYAYVLDFTYNAATWDQSANGTYDANKLYSNIYTYTNGAWTVSGVYDGSVTVYDGSSTEQSSAAAAVLTQTGNVNGFKWNGSLVTDIAVGSIGKGQTFPVGTMLEYIIRKMFYKAPTYTPAYMSVSTSVSGSVIKGTSSSAINITIHKNNSGDLESLTIYDPYDNQTHELTATLANGVYTASYTPSVDTYTEGGTFSVIAKVKAGTNVAAQTLQDSVTISISMKWYAGTIDLIYPDEMPTAAQVKALAKSGTATKGTINITTDKNPAHVGWIIAYPSNFTLSFESVKSDGQTETYAWSQLIATNTEELNIDDTEYKLFIRYLAGGFGSLIEMIAKLN